jgi:hypothetical protein
MFWIFRRKTKLELLHDSVKKDIKRASKEQMVRAAISIKIFHNILMHDHGGLSEFATVSKEVQNNFLNTIDGAGAQDKGVSIGSGCLLVYIISSLHGEVKTFLAITKEIQNILEIHYDLDEVGLGGLADSLNTLSVAELDSIDG